MTDNNNQEDTNIENTNNDSELNFEVDFSEDAEKEPELDFSIFEPLKEILSQSGLVYHPEVIKLFYKIGELSQEDNLSHYGTPSIEELTPAQILYGTKD